MRDAEFKSYPHPVPPGCYAEQGKAVGPGYFPDVVVFNVSGNSIFILECESKTDRKAFLGDLVKAEKHAQESGQTPELIIVMKQYKNTTALQIAQHLGPYRAWLAGNSKKRKQSLPSVQILYDTEYIQAEQAGEILGSSEFKKRGHVL